MSTGILLIGSSDRHLESVLRACGMTAPVAAAAELDILAQPGGRTPDVVVLDVRDQAQLPHGLAIFKRSHPAAGVILVTDRIEPGLLLEAMRAGVTEVVTTVTEDELQASIGRLTALRPQAASHPAKVFAFLGAKGGVGTTTVAVNVATALAKLDPGSTLLIDLHVANGDAAVLLGAEPRFSILDALENTHRLDESFFRSLVARTKPGVDLLASSDHLTGGPVDVRRVQGLLEFAGRHYRYLVLDVPRADAAVLDALESATRIIVVTNQELTTVRSASRIAAALRQRYGRDRLHVVLSRADRLADIGEEDIERAVGSTLRHSFPSDYRRVLQALNRGMPITVENHNELAGSFMAFARDLSGIDKRPAARAASRFGLLGLVRPRGGHRTRENES